MPSFSSSPECIGPKLVDNVHWIRVVFQSFAHFVSVRCLDQTVDDQVLEGWFVKEGSGHNQQSVEPARGEGQCRIEMGLFSVLCVCVVCAI